MATWVMEITAVTNFRYMDITTIITDRLSIFMGIWTIAAATAVIATMAISTMVIETDICKVVTGSFKALCALQ